MKIIPAIDIIDGKCVRLSQGDYEQKKIYAADPLEMAKQFENAGLKYLHVVDLDGAKSDGIVNWRVLERLANETKLSIDFGGGLKSSKDLEIAFNCGAKQLTIGSVAARSPALFLDWCSTYGRDRMILGADVKDGMIATNGWLDSSDNQYLPFIEFFTEKGIRSVICTDISKDGMLNGIADVMYAEIIKRLPQVELIASGGVSQLADLDLAKNIGCKGIIIGKAIYENKISLKELETYAN